MTEHVLKLLVLGDPATGKTSIIKRYVHNLFSGHHKTTVGVDFQLKQLRVDDQNVRLQLWDIAGQDRFGAISRVYYKDAMGAMVVFDLSRPDTFETVAKWKREIDSKVTLPNGEPLPIVLMGNKCDLEIVDVNEDLLNDYCKRFGFVGWFATSAKTNHNIAEASQFLVRSILDHGDCMNNDEEKAQDIQPLTAAKPASSGSCC